jgi:hypothetical protein
MGVTDNDGQSVVGHVGKNVPQLREMGNVAESGYQGTSTACWIKEDKIVSELAGTPVEVAVYSLLHPVGAGTRFQAIRSDGG